MQIPETVMQELAVRNGTTLASLSYLGGGHAGADGIVYQYSSQGKEWALKFIPMPLKDENGFARLQERMQFVHYAGENGVPLVYPVPSLQGNLAEQLIQGETRYVAYRMAKAAGSPPPAPREWSDAFLREWGRIIGRLHRLSQGYKADGKPLLGWEQEWQGFYDWCKDDAVRADWVALKAELERLPVDRNGYGFIHNDPHAWNLMADGDRLTLLDFDVANYHWFATDIAIALYGACCADAGGAELPTKTPGLVQRFMEQFMTGYEQENHLDPIWLDRLELFLHYRRSLMYIVYYEALQQKNPRHLDLWRKRILDHSPVMSY